MTTVEAIPTELRPRQASAVSEARRVATLTDGYTMSTATEAQKGKQYGERYIQVAAACKQISRRREPFARPILASQILNEIDVNIPNDALLAHIIAESLLRRIDRTLLSRRNVYLGSDAGAQIDLFRLLSRALPVVSQGHAIANQYLLTALRTQRTSALFEIGIGDGAQVIALLHELARDPGMAQKVRLIALEPNPLTLATSAARIDALRPVLPFEVDVFTIPKLLERCDDDDFMRIYALAEGALIINSAYAFSHVVGDAMLQVRLVSALQNLRPLLFTLAEFSPAIHSGDLINRLQKCWKHFSALFELIDQTDVSSYEKYILKERYCGGEIRSALATEDLRHGARETVESWLLLMRKAGFVPHPRINLEIGLPDNAGAIVSSGLVRLLYRNVPIVYVLAYTSVTT